ncbi:DUF1289 domain-containing protein [Allorhodopirellula solitaria]|uniref:Fe-S protein n=1 Tax=Allorhodopirellula solitaria TaxID=2527987 RepID=A0A5C5YKP1_9BACT|nr:DUF1289 domain-containing protein [Allorhodopirellula solitaria]TWT75417.1 hypothetical protein CA85_07080 [Allorhodopirellula solitaria]
MTQASVVRSPCTGICLLNEREICTGCHRSRSEIGRWSIASSEEKRSILGAVRSRRFAAITTQPTNENVKPD